MILILAIFGIAFALKEIDGPFFIASNIRNLLMRIPYMGVFFFQLLDCYFCTGFHAGWIGYLLSMQYFEIKQLILYAFAGGTIGLLFDGILGHLHK